jgi:hypothetical protein
MTNLEKQANDIISSTAAFGTKAGKLLLSKRPGKRGGTSKTKTARKAERKARRGNRK